MYDCNIRAGKSKADSIALTLVETVVEPKEIVWYFETLHLLEAARDRERERDGQRGEKERER